MAGRDDTMAAGAGRPSRMAEFLTFLALAFGVWPFVAVGVVGAVGFIIWMAQLVVGPPGPPTVPH